MLSYKEIADKVLTHGAVKGNRTGTPTLSLSGLMFEHDMSKGFPLLTTKRMAWRAIRAELQFFIMGYTNKRWLQNRGVHIWDQWCSPEKVPYGTDPETRQRMREETSLGPIYGAQWRNFNGVDQFANLIDTIKKDPDDRAMIVTAWNPAELNKMALRPCHYGFQIVVTDGRMDLLWNQRSVDVCVGLPFNIASYGLLLLLLCMETGYRPGRLVGFLGDTHIYSNHIEGITEQLKRTSRKLPAVLTTDWKGILAWDYKDSVLFEYDPHPAIKYPVAV